MHLSTIHLDVVQTATGMLHTDTRGFYWDARISIKPKLITFKAPRQAEKFTLVTILQGCKSGDLIEKQQHQVKQDIPERAPLSHITVNGFSHDLQDATSVPSKET
ncbi:hypothetical protein BTVI_151520 [Pitangus sulphuratus]|nr:hypothetical protein BTVI_151520 [Pitangus sulphuratus]